MVVAQVHSRHIAEVIGRRHGDRSGRCSAHDVELSHSTGSHIIEHIDMLHAVEVEGTGVLRQEEGQRGRHAGMLGHAVIGQARQVGRLVPRHDLEEVCILGFIAEEYFEHIECVGHHFVIDGGTFHLPWLCTEAEGRLGEFESGKGSRYRGDGERRFRPVWIVDGFDVLHTQLGGLLPSVDGVGTLMESEYVGHISNVVFLFYHVVDCLLMDGHEVVVGVESAQLLHRHVRHLAVDGRIALQVFAEEAFQSR